MAPRVYDSKGRKRCNCSIHQGEFIDLSNFTLRKSGYRKGLPLARCKWGEEESKGRVGNNPLRGYLLLSDPVVRNTIIELERRIGQAETIRRCRLNTVFFRNFYGKNKLRKPQRRIQKRTFKKLLEVLIEVRQKDEVIHRDSIKRGAVVRGEKVKRPVDPRDYYVPTGDSDLEQRRAHRAKNREAQNLREREYKRKRTAELKSKREAA